MAYVQVPRDLSKYETKLALNLTKRQLICFSLGVLVGVPTYLFLKDILEPDLNAMITFLILSPFFAMGIYKKDGIPFEQYMYIVIRYKYLRVKNRKNNKINLKKILEKKEG